MKLDTFDFVTGQNKAEEIDEIIKETLDKKMKNIDIDKKKYHEKLYLELDDYIKEINEGFEKLFLESPDYAVDLKNSAFKRHKESVEVRIILYDQRIEGVKEKLKEEFKNLKKNLKSYIPHREFSLETL